LEVKAWWFSPLPMPEEVIMQGQRMGTFDFALNFDESDNDYLRNDNDDVRLGSSNYRNISQSELADLLNNYQTQVE
jgi:hypothetical protein